MPGNQSDVRCPYCNSQHVWKDGVRYSENREIQRYRCRECGRRFSENTAAGSNLTRSNKFKHGQGVYTKLLCNGGALPSHRQICAGVAKNLARQLQREKAGEKLTKDVKGKIIEFLWYLKKQGYAKSTVSERPKMMKRLVKRGADLSNPEQVKEIIAKQETWSNGYKLLMKYAYQAFMDMEGLTWKPPRYQRREKMPFVPSEAELGQLIGGAGKTVSIFLQALKETGADPGEIMGMKWMDINKENNTISINRPVKRHNARILPVSSDLIERLSLLPRKAERVFSMDSHSMYTNYWHQRKRMARNFKNPRLLKITFTTFRHWKATTEYHRTKDVLHVKQLLGHKSLNSTMIYIDIEKATYTKNENSEFITRVTKSDKGARSLVEAGFEYVCETPSRMMLFRKRK